VSVVDDLLAQLKFLNDGQVDKNWIDISALIKIAENEHLTREFIIEFNNLANSQFQGMVKAYILRCAGILSISAEKYNDHLKITNSFIIATGGGVFIAGAAFTFTGSSTVSAGARVAAPLLAIGFAIMGLGGLVLYRWSAKRRAKLSAERALNDLHRRL